MQSRGHGLGRTPSAGGTLEILKFKKMQRNQQHLELLLLLVDMLSIEIARGGDGPHNANNTFSQGVVESRKLKVFLQSKRAVAGGRWASQPQWR